MRRICALLGAAAVGLLLWRSRRRLLMRRICALLGPAAVGLLLCMAAGRPTARGRGATDQPQSGEDVVGPGR
jgi:hypothetical protein